MNQSDITAVIGHRGTGKSELMKRLRFYQSDQVVDLVDLDSEIEDKIGKTIPELFLEHGEAYFRGLERQLFLEILQKPHKKLYLFLGAGFDLNVIPETVHVLWVNRKTDLDGRIFLNRPRLNPELSPLEEYRKRAHLREPRYRQRADEIYLMPEGEFENHHLAMAVEKSILNHSLKNVGGIMTIPSEVLSTAARWSSFKERYSGRGISFFELRDDFLSLDQIGQIIEELQAENFIYSFRKIQNWNDFWSNSQNLEIIKKVSWVDWAWELGVPNDIFKYISKEKIILSLHDSAKKEEWQKFENSVGHMKYAPEILSFSGLNLGHSWQSVEPKGRSFLPRSANGRWDWYRLLQKEKQLLNFWREGDGSAGDQPSLFAWSMSPAAVKKFAAVLGEPVIHSYTPLEHSDFFYKREQPVFAISIQRDEWDGALPVLQSLGLSYAAVTSPQKENAANLCRHSELKAVNTLYWNQQSGSWLGTSTDDTGFLELIEGIGMISPLQKDIFVWGGGGILEVLEKALPNATYFSARTGQVRKKGSSLNSNSDSDLNSQANSILISNANKNGKENTNANTNTNAKANAPVDLNATATQGDGSKESHDEVMGLQPKIVIWAAPRTGETLMPPSTWNPVMVYDLNYKEDSMGREYAQKCGANYQSGLAMFKAQAQGQRLFWSHCEEQT